MPWKSSVYWKHEEKTGWSASPWHARFLCERMRLVGGIRRCQCSLIIWSLQTSLKLRKESTMTWSTCTETCRMWSCTKSPFIAFIFLTCLRLTVPLSQSYSILHCSTPQRTRSKGQSVPFVCFPIQFLQAWIYKGLAKASSISSFDSSWPIIFVVTAEVSQQPLLMNQWTNGLAKHGLQLGNQRGWNFALCFIRLRDDWEQCVWCLPRHVG